jgi:hypothetical protein
MADLHSSNIESIFTALSELMAARGLEPVSLLVCGGSALVVSGIVARSTSDVDVIGTRNFDGEISALYPLPEDLTKCADLTGREFGLKSGWLNASASLFGNLDELPQQTWTDLEDREYGSHLKVSFIGRSGQIFLKFDATCDRNEARDIEDLLGS